MARMKGKCVTVSLIDDSHSEQEKDKNVNVRTLRRTFGHCAIQYKNH